MKTKKCTFILAFLLLVFNFSNLQGEEKSQSIRVCDLKSEYQTNPIGIDVAPRFSWRLESDKRGYYRPLTRSWSPPR